MDATSQIREAHRALEGLESGHLSVADVYPILDQLDPVLVYFIIHYLREKYSPTNPQSAGVTTRLLELTSTYPELVKKARKGEQDSITEWFNDTYSFREYFHQSHELIELIVDKLES